MNKLILSFFLLGLSFGVGPCLVSCGPLLISYIAGTQKEILKSTAAYFLFSLSRILIYIIISLAIFFFQEATKYALGGFTKYLFFFGGIFIAILGMLIAFGKNLNFKFCRIAENFFLKKDAKTVILLGFIVAIMPCAPLISVIAYIGLVSRNWLNSLLYSLSFGLGTVSSPLLVLVVGAGFIPRIMAKSPIAKGIFNFLCGAIIVFLGIQIIRRGF